jgi:hypothetical protein
MTILDKLDQFQRVIDAATPGPWDVGFHDRSGSGEYGGGCYIVDNDDPCHVVVRGGESEGIPIGVESKLDAQFIAQSRTFSDQQNRALRVAMTTLQDGINHEGYDGGIHLACSDAIRRIQAILNEGDGK